mgnify:CR=1 FL=1
MIVSGCFSKTENLEAVQDKFLLVFPLFKRFLLLKWPIIGR